MGEPARVLDDVSDRLGDVLRHADELLAAWSEFGAQVRRQVDHEVVAIGDTVEAAVARTATASLDRSIAERLGTLTAELAKLEQRARAASRTIAEHQRVDRRALWTIAAGVIVANIVLIALWLRPAYAPPPPPDPVRSEATPVVAPPATTPAAPDQSAGSAAGSADDKPAPSAPPPAVESKPAAAGSDAAGDHHHPPPLPVKHAPLPHAKS